MAALKKAAIVVGTGTSGFYSEIYAMSGHLHEVHILTLPVLGL